MKYIFILQDPPNGVWTYEFYSLGEIHKFIKAHKCNLSYVTIIEKPVYIDPAKLMSDSAYD